MFAAADIVGRRKADVVEAVVGEVSSRYGSSSQLALVLNSDEAALGVVGDRLLVAGDPAVERRLGGDDGALEGGDRLGDVLRGDALAGEGGLSNSVLIAGMALSRSSSIVHRHVHLARRLDRAERLLLERFGAAVPEEDLALGGVDDGGRAAAEPLHQMADAGRLAVRPSRRPGYGTTRTRAGWPATGAYRNRASCRAPPSRGCRDCRPGTGSSAGGDSSRGRRRSSAPSCLDSSILRVSPTTTSAAARRE